MLTTVLALAFCAGAVPASASVQVDVGVNLSAFFDVPRAEIDIHLRDGHPPEDLGRSYYVARESGVPVNEVLVLRKQGWAWGRIYGRYGMGAGDVDGAWVMVREGKGHYKHHGKAKGHDKKHHDDDGGDDKKGQHGHGRGK